MRRLAWTLLWFAAALPSRAAAIAESFYTNPALREWRTFGDGSLFHWNATNQNLEVTWDSLRTNSLFYRPLGTVLTKRDDFSFGFDLRLRDIMIGVDPEKPYTFQIAISLCEFSSITNTNFFRGAGRNPTYGPRNLVEFNYFPAFSQFAPTIAQVIVGTNNDKWFYNHDNLLEMAPGDLFHVAIEFRREVLTTTVEKDGQVYGRPQIIDLRSTSADFRVDTFAVISYSGAVQSPPQYAGSILAHGIVDNVHWTVPDPPLVAFTGRFRQNFFRAEFEAKSNWVYSLEVTPNLRDWYLTAAAVAVTNGPMALEDSEASPNHGFYRVIADRP